MLLTECHLILRDHTRSVNRHNLVHTLFSEVIFPRSGFLDETSGSLHWASFSGYSGTLMGKRKSSLSWLLTENKAVICAGNSLLHWTLIRLECFSRHWRPCQNWYIKKLLSTLCFAYSAKNMEMFQLIIERWTANIWNLRKSCSEAGVNSCFLWVSQIWHKIFALPWVQSLLLPWPRIPPAHVNDCSNNFLPFTACRFQ